MSSTTDEFYEDACEDYEQDEQEQIEASKVALSTQDKVELIALIDAEIEFQTDREPTRAIQDKISYLTDLKDKLS